MKPLLKWSGNKQDELQHIIPHVPASFDTYVEPFLGGAAVFFELRPEKAVLNDIHPELMTFYRQIGAGNAERIYDLMKNHPNNEDTYYRVRDVFEPQDDIEKAFKFYYLRKHCYRGMLRYNKDGKFNIPYGRYKTMNYEILKNNDYHRVLNNATLLNGDFQVVFDNYNSPENFCFIDQPYDSKFTDYGYCSFGRSDQERLAKAFKETQMKCLMIVGETDYIRNLYDGYIVDSYPKKYKFKLHSGRIGDNINTNHLIIKNY